MRTPQDDGEDQAVDDLSLLLRFDTDAPEFVRGFELGRIWNELRTQDGEVVALVHARNAEMVMRMAEATDRRVVSEELGGWLEVTFSAADPELWL